MSEKKVLIVDDAVFMRYMRQPTEKRRLRCTKK